MIHSQYYVEQAKLERLQERKNRKSDFYNGVFDRYEDPVLTRDHVPVTWKYDINEETNPYFMERLGVNAVMNSGAIELNGKYYLVARVEGADRKSFFAVAESETGVDGFKFWDYSVVLPDTCPEETNVYDMRLTKHEDGYIYGVFCSESKDKENPDLSAAVAAAGIVRTKDLKTWERLDNLKTLHSPQQRNVVLHPEFVDGKYAFYTRPMDGFIETGSGGGIGFGLCEDIEHAVIDEEKIISRRVYHTLTESKNGAGAVPIKGKKCWIHIAHGVRNTAAGLRYVLYVFGTDLEQPDKLIAQPSGVFLVPLGKERVGDVSNVVFTNGAIAKENKEAEEKQDAGNESGFDKFFFQWSKGELDAVILTKDFLKYCTSVGGEYCSADEFEIKDLNLCEAGGIKAIDLTGTKLESELDGTEKEDLVLVFQATGIHKEMCQKYIDFLSEK